MNVRPDQCAVVFDWNGTLLDDSALILAATNQVIERALGGSPVCMGRYRQAYCLPLHRLYERLGIDHAVVEKNIDDVFQVWLNHYNAHADTTRLRSGARTVLNGLKAKEHRTTILSNHMSDVIETQARRLNIHHFFDDILANHPDEYHTIL